LDYLRFVSSNPGISPPRDPETKGELKGKQKTLIVKENSHNSETIREVKAATALGIEKYGSE
jgi:hypothetical protein